MTRNRCWLLLLFVVASICVLAVGAYRLSPARTVGRTLQLDAVTQKVFAQAVRVDVFRLADFHEGNRSVEEYGAIGQNKYGTVNDYTLTRRGVQQNAVFAGKLLSALQKVGDPAKYFPASCFDPGVGFRVWHSREHTDIFVCFYCSGVDISTTDAHGHIVWQTRTDLGEARSSLLALSRQVFPDDKALQQLKG